MNHLQRFFATLLDASGAVVQEIEPEGLEVLAPRPVQQTLQLPEWVRLGFGADLPDGAHRVTLESQMMDRVTALLGDRGRFACRVIAPPNPPLANPERTLEQHLDLRNATYRLEGVAPAWTCYDLFRFRYTAISDEKRDGLLDFALNRATRAAGDELLPELVSAAEAAAPPAGSPSLPPFPWTPPQFTTLLHRALPPRLRRHLASFFRGMTRRQERDLERLFAYHQDLCQEAAARLAALTARGELTEKQQAEQARERLRLEAVAREYHAKVEDARQKYAVKVELEWLQTLQVVMPVQRLTLRLRRRKGERVVALDWNPLARRLEQLPCEYSYTWERAREMCDEALHLVSPPAHGPCPVCDKPFCRACHPEQCPRCGRRES